MDILERVGLALRELLAMDNDRDRRAWWSVS